jgi:hypothetical protein
LKDSFYLVRENLNTFDFWIWGFYANFFKNPLRYAPERLSAAL